MHFLRYGFVPEAAFTGGSGRQMIKSRFLAKTAHEPYAVVLLYKS
jgi:hypothetical protein